jgi:hypothetical protein
VEHRTHSKRSGRTTPRLVRRWRRRPKGRPGKGSIVQMQKLISRRRPSGATNSSASDTATSGAQEQAWIESHWREYLGRWVALDGSRLLGEAAGPREALEKARALGVSAPFLMHVTEPSDLPFGGW